MTGVRYFTARRTASMAMAKQSLGFWGARMGRRLPVPSVHGVEEVGLLRLGGQAGRRATPLHVDDDQRQLEVDGQADGLGLEVETGTTGGGHPQRAAEGRPSAAPTPAISSSAWKVRMPNSLRRLSSGRMSDAGVIG